MVSCVYSLIVGLFIYKQMTIKDLPGILARAAVTTGTCLILLGGATLFGRILTGERIPTLLATAVLSITDNKFLILLIINIILFFTGMFMESIAAILILAPLLLSMVENLGMTPLHFGVVMVMNLTVGLCTPPVGVNCFVASRKAGVGLEKMMKWLAPAVGLLMAVVLLFTYCTPLVNLGPNIIHALQGK